jgi:hypothetical protein
MIGVDSVPVVFGGDLDLDPWLPACDGRSSESESRGATELLEIARFVDTWENEDTVTAFEGRSPEGEAWRLLLIPAVSSLVSVAHEHDMFLTTRDSRYSPVSFCG